MGNEMPFQHYLLGLFAVANNFSAIGMFLAICQGLDKKQQLKLCYIATATAFLTMTITLLTGQMVLEFFGISISAFRIAGGILLAVSGLSMLNKEPSSDIKKDENSLSKMISVAIVPIGIPLTTGGGTISTIILYSGKLNNWGLFFKLFGVICIMTLIIYLIFRYSTWLLKVLGHVGLNVLIKIMGLFTLAIGVQFITSGLAGIFPVLTR